MTESLRTVVIAPAFEEALGIAAFIRAVGEAAAGLPERRIALVVVDDGSRDATYERAREAAAQAPAIDLVTVRLARNFGQQAALHAGLELAFARFPDAAAFVIMDSDLQHPPALLGTIVGHLAGGAHHVRMLRAERADLGLWKRTTSALFYRAFSFLSDIEIPRGSSDFRGFSREFVKQYLKLPERARFNRGIFHWLGFPVVSVPYDAPERTTGETKYSTWRMMRLALVGLTYFSNRPLVAVLGGTVAISALFCAAYVVFELSRWWRGVQYVVGWPTLVFFVMAWGGVLAFGQLLLGLYVARIFDEVKARPIYVVAEITPPSPLSDP